MAENIVAELMPIDEPSKPIRKKRIFKENDRLRWVEGNARKASLLGMPAGTAMGRLRKDLIFRMSQRLGEDVCYRCGKVIETSAELSIEHKESWQTSAAPVETFFDVENIAFSHLRCNSSAAKRPTKIFGYPDLGVE